MKHEGKGYFEEEKASNGDPRNMEFVQKAMQQQFDLFNLVFGEMRDGMDSQDTVIENFHRVPNGNPNLRRPVRHDRGHEDLFECENEEGNRSEGGYEFETEIGRNRPRGVRYERSYEGLLLERGMGEMEILETSK